MGRKIGGLRIIYFWEPLYILKESKNHTLYGLLCEYHLPILLDLSSGFKNVLMYLKKTLTLHYLFKIFYSLNIFVR